MSQKKSLKNSLLCMAILPILILGILVTILSMQRVSKALHKQVESELSGISYTVRDILDIVYPGEYTLYGNKVLTLAKGEDILNDHFEFIDSIKQDTGLEISVFYEDIRFLTTILDSSRNRILGKKAHAIVQREVLQTGQARFYDSAVIGEEEYFAYYLPLFHSDGSCIGMIGVAKPSRDVNKMIYESSIPILVMACLVMIITAIATTFFATRLIIDLTKLKNFMKAVSKGNLKTELDYQLMKREDEITDMGKSAVNMQKSLRELIELDALTQLENRRSANNSMKVMQKNLMEMKEPYVLVLGDIDFFKKVNDNYGHDAGDEVLKFVAGILKNTMKNKGFAARWGGEEFLLGFRDSSLEKATKTVQAMLEEVRQHTVEYKDVSIQVTMSFGVAQARAERTIDENVKAADAFLYYAKEHGRNQVVAEAYESEELEENKQADGNTEQLNHILIDKDIMDYIKGIKNGNGDMNDNEQ